MFSDGLCNPISTAQVSVQHAIPVFVLLLQKRFGSSEQSRILEADWENWKPGDLRPYVETALEAFTPQRCMYGSDWPVCLLRALRRGIRPRPKGATLPEGCEESAWDRLRAEWGVAGRVIKKRRSEPDRERAIIEQHAQHATVLVFGSSGEANAFLATVGDG